MRSEIRDCIHLEFHHFVYQEFNATEDFTGLDSLSIISSRMLESKDSRLTCISLLDQIWVKRSRRIPKSRWSEIAEAD